MDNYIKKVIPMYMGRVGFKHNKQFLKVYSYLIFTKEEVYLYDSGLNSLFITDREKILNDLAIFMLVEVKEDETLLSKLSENGISIKQIKGVICSHLHFDHAGGLNCFKDTEVPIYMDQLEYLDALETKRSFEYKKEDFGFLQEAGNLSFIDDNLLIDENPCIEIVKTPGHSAGHVSLLLSGKEKKMLLTGDAVYTTSNMLSNKVTPFSYKKQVAQDSLALLNKYKQQCDYVICGHDPDVFADKTIEM